MSEAEAAKAVMAEEMVRQSRQNIKDVFLATNRMDLWDDMQKKMAEARKARQEEIKRQEMLRRKRKRDDRDCHRAVDCRWISAIGYRVGGLVGYILAMIVGIVLAVWLAYTI